MLDPQAVRAHFPALSRTHNGHPVAYFDGPAGSQVPQSVADAVRAALLDCCANRGGVIATSRATDEMMNRAAEAAADFVGSDDSSEIVFGPNMTSLTYSLSRAIAADWGPGDEIILSRLDHDANITPWVQEARDRGVGVHYLDVNLEDCTLDLTPLQTLLNPRTRLVAIGYASNATGTINPVKEICESVRKNSGAIVWVDAVHFAPHGLIDVREVNCDFLVCSAYKFFGPHVGILWGRRRLLEDLPARKLRPAPSTVPERWMPGTQNHEGIAGVTAAIDYLASLSEAANSVPRRERLQQSFAAITQYEQTLLRQLITGLSGIPSFRVWGITHPAKLNQRVPTISLTHQNWKPHKLAEELAEQGLFAWAGNHYALSFTEKADLEPQGTLRLGLLHYNTSEEVDRLLNVLEKLIKAAPG